MLMIMLYAIIYRVGEWVFARVNECVVFDNKNIRLRERESDWEGVEWAEHML